jgi:hypothetical protein
MMSQTQAANTKKTNLLPIKMIKNLLVTTNLATTKNAIVAATIVNVMMNLVMNLTIIKIVSAIVMIATVTENLKATVAIK